MSRSSESAADRPPRSLSAEEKEAIEDSGQVVDAIAAQVLLHEVLESSKVATVILARDFRAVWTNRAWEVFMGLERAPSYTRDLRGVLDGELREVLDGPPGFVDRVLDSYTRGRFLEGVECRVAVGSGREERWLEYSSQEIRFGPFAGGRIEYFTDVSSRRRAEDDLRSSEERYRRLFEQSKDVVYVSRPDGQLIDMNPAGIELFGYASKDEALEMDITSQWADAEKRREFLAEVARQGFVKDFEIELLAQGGSRMTLRVTASAIRGEGGALAGVMGIMRDVTSERHLEDQLRQAQKMEAVGRLAGGIAHDFNNLLTAINGYSQLLAHTVEEGPAKGYVEEIRRAGKRAAEMTTNLLRISRRQVLHPQVVEVPRLIGDLRRMLQPMIGEDVRLETHIAPDVGRLKVDPGQMEQVLINLAVNARDAMPTGGNLTVTAANVDLERPHFDVPAGTWVCLAVSDTGTGMEPEIVEHIFEPLFTTKDKGKGTGFGLAMVYNMVTRSNGFILVDSTPGEGTTFEIFLPRAEETSSPAVRSPAEASPPERGDERILLVEDDDGVRALVKELLGHQGYQVLEAKSGAQALKLLAAEDGAVDLLVSDVVMPAMSGPELALELRPRYPDLKVLFISGYHEDVTSQHGLSQIRHEVLHKPFDARKLAVKVREILDTGQGAGIASPEK